MKIKPQKTKSRYACPFYGFHLTKNGAIDQGKDQCCLITIKNTPCKMHVDGSIPSWNKCYQNVIQNRLKVRNILKNYKIFPKEFKTDKGIDFKDWFEYIMSEDTPRLKK